MLGWVHPILRIPTAHYRDLLELPAHFMSRFGRYWREGCSGRDSRNSQMPGKPPRSRCCPASRPKCRPSHFGAAPSCLVWFSTKSTLDDSNRLAAYYRLYRAFLPFHLVCGRPIDIGTGKAQEGHEATSACRPVSSLVSLRGFIVFCLSHV